MSSIVNLFSNFDLTKPKSINDIAKEYNNNKIDVNDLTPALTQGDKFIKYQKKIKRKNQNKFENVNIKEGFNSNLVGLQLSDNGLTNQSNNIIQNNDYSSQTQTIENLKQHYQDTLSKYEEIISQISDSTTNYLNRVSDNNPYLNKTVRFKSGHIAYVTNQGVVKYIPSTEILNSVKAPQQYVQLNIDWDEMWSTPGANIPTTPPLVSGTVMESGQSLGNEGSNIYVNTMITNPQTKYEGCYADNISSPLMTFIGDTPPPPTNLQNGNFEYPQLNNNSFRYITSNSTVPGWNFAAVLLNNSKAWGYPTPYPNGNQCICIQGGGQYIAQTVYLQSGVDYSISFNACGRDCCDRSREANPININLYTVKSEYISTIYKFQPPISKWTKYTTTFNVPKSQNYQIYFNGTWTKGDRSTAIQNIQLNTNNLESKGSYTYEQCQNAAIDAGYQFFGLQNVNSTNSQGYCAVSNSQPSATRLGEGTISNGQIMLWSSKTNNSDPGATASLTNTGALSVFGSSGNAVFSTPNSNAQPSNYLGCYGESSNRAMTLHNNGSPEYNLTQCQEIAKQNNSTFFGLQNSTSGTNAQCALSSDLNQTIKYGPAGNCTKLNDGSWSGGGWSNAVYNTTAPNSNYYLILQDDGNMCIYRGTGPTDNQGIIWESGTTGKQQQANPKFAAINGKYGKNWVSSGSTLARGDFIGSTNGNMVLILQSDGNLVLYTFTITSNCFKMSDGNTGGGVGANALYNIGDTGVQSNIGQVAYIDENSELHKYPSTNIQYTNLYTTIQSTNSMGSDIPGAAYSNASVQQCEQTCNKNNKCAGFVMSSQGKVCSPKTSSMYPNGARQIDKNATLYIRGSAPINTPIGISKNIRNVDSVAYQKYINGGEFDKEYGLANATSTQKQQLSQLQTQMNLITNKINDLTGKFGTGSHEAETQSMANVTGIQDYLNGIETNTNKIKHFDTSVENILNDSDIVVLQKNYEYLLWSILAAGTVLITMNIVKK
jgi:hypothetical protein